MSTSAARLSRVVLAFLLTAGCAVAPSEDGAGGADPNDADGDAIIDADDNCPGAENADQADYNGDGIGDACDEIVIPISSLGEDATFFEFDGMDATISYFVVLDADGHPHAAFDACDVCYGAHKGYRQDGDVMVCNNCGNEFEIDGIGSENSGGGCWPGFLPVDVTDTDVILQPEDLEAGSWYFE